MDELGANGPGKLISVGPAADQARTPISEAKPVTLPGFLEIDVRFNL